MGLRTYLWIAKKYMSVHVQSFNLFHREAYNIGPCFSRFNGLDKTWYVIHNVKAEF